jgi:ribose 5-phosphate isomerase
LKICRRNGVKVIIVVDNKKFVDRLQWSSLSYLHVPPSTLVN